VVIPVGFADCYRVTLMEHWGLTDILTFDTGFDKLPGITRRQE